MKRGSSNVIRTSNRQLIHNMFPIDQDWAYWWPPGDEVFALILFLAFCLPARASEYVLSYYNPNANYPVCSATLSRSCGTGITIWELIGGQWTLVVKQSFRATQYIMPVFPTAGPHTYGLWAAYKDASGVQRHTTLYQKTLNVPTH